MMGVHECIRRPHGQVGVKKMCLVNIRVEIVDKKSLTPPRKSSQTKRQKYSVFILRVRVDRKIRLKNSSQWL